MGSGRTPTTRCTLRRAERSRRSAWGAAALVAAAVGVSACHGRPVPPKASRANASEAQAPPPLAPLADAAQLREAGDAHWPQRDERSALEAAIAAYEQAYVAAPTDGVLAIRLAHGYAFLISAFLRPAGDRVVMQRTSARALVVAEMALRSSSPEFAGRLQREGPLEDAVALLQKGSVPALSAYVEALGAYASTRGQSTALFYAQRLKACIERLLVLDERYAAALPHRYMALWMSHVPAFVGGSTARARTHFRQALALSDNAPANLVAYAQFAENNAKERSALSRALLVAAQAPPPAPTATPVPTGDELVWGAAEERYSLREARRLVAPSR